MACLSPQLCLTALNPHPATTLSPISGWACLFRFDVSVLFKKLCSLQSKGASGFCVQRKGLALSSLLPQTPHAHVGRDA